MKVREVKTGVRVRHSRVAVHLPGFPAIGTVVSPSRDPRFVRVHVDGMSPWTIGRYALRFWVVLPVGSR